MTVGYSRRAALGFAGAMTVATMFAAPARADGTFKIGLVIPLTGQQTTTGKQIEAAMRLFIAQHGASAGGKTIVLIVKDDASLPDNSKRMAQELVVNDHVDMLAGFGITPSAMAVAPLATQAKVPMLVTAAATSIVTEQSPFIVRTSFTLAQETVPMADWALANKIKTVVTFVSDYAPGIDSEKAFKERFAKGGGEIVGEIRAPLRGPEFAPYLQKVKDLAPDAVFLFVPAGQGALLMKQVAERELGKAGIRIIATGDVVDDDQLKDMGDSVLGMVTAGIYSAAHASPENKAFVEAYKKASGGARPGFFAVCAYDGIDLVYRALEKTKGEGGAALVETMKGMSWMSPRGPVSIDAQTRDIVQNVYIRKVEKLDGENHNVEFATVEAVKDPVKAAK